jgi:hypothetical protein
MANSTRNPTLKGPRGKLGTIGARSSSLVNPWLELQRLQWEALHSWQQSLATLNKDVWEQWTVRYAGGIPIDG